MSGDLPQSLRSVGAVGTPTFSVGPGRVAIPMPALDGRTHALTIFRRYLAAIVWNKSNGPTLPVTPFQVPETNILFEWPSYEKNLKLPAINIAPADPDGVTLDFIGNVPFMDPGSEDKYQKGTAVYSWAEHIEDLHFIITAQDTATRTALIAGLQVALNPIQEMSGVRFRMADYFDETVIFSLEGGGRVDNEEASKNRWSAEFTVKMRFNLSYLANAVDMHPEVEFDSVPDTTALDAAGIPGNG